MEEIVVHWCNSPRAVVNAILCRRVGVAVRWSPLRRPVKCLLAKAAEGMCTVFATRAHSPRPRRGHGRGPAVDGDDPKVTEEGGLRRGRSVRGEYRFDAG